MDTQIYGFGPNADEPAQVDPTSGTLRVSLRPIEYTPSAGGTIGGHYKIATLTGTMAAGIASLASVFQVRWADPSKLFMLQRILVQCSTGTGFAATTLGCPLELRIGHGSTANGSGGTALAPSSISNRMRSSMAASGFVTSGEIRIATTGALTAATGNTAEPNAVGQCMGAPNATLAQSVQMVLFETTPAGDHPLILNSGDTLSIRTVTPAATGTWFMAVTMEWVEAINF
jgi:hypothetical protein